jgi:hypothetical protein
LSITNINPPTEGVTVTFIPNGQGGFSFPVTFADDANPVQVGWQIDGDAMTFVVPPTNRTFTLGDSDCPNTDGTVVYDLLMSAWYPDGTFNVFPRHFSRGPNA